MAKFSAFGTELWKDGAKVAQVTAISGPGLSIDLADVTTHDQTTPHEYLIPTLIRTGELTLDVAFDPNDASHIDMLASLAAREVDGFELRFPDTAFTSWTFSGYVVGFEPSAPVDDALTGSFTVKPIGAINTSGTYTP